MADPIFRTDDARWGLTGNGGSGTGSNTAGTGGNLTPKQNDENTWAWLVRMRTVETSLADHVGFATDTEGPVSIAVNQLTFRFNDNSEATVTIPMPRPNTVEDWQPATLYVPFDFVGINGSIYLVLFEHTSAGSFDPGANDGFGHDYYGLFFTAPSMAIPTYGTTGQRLAKRSNANYDMQWVSDTLEGLTDVDLSTALGAGDFLKFDGSNWINAVPDFSDLAGTIAPEQFTSGLQPLAQTVAIATDGSLAINLADGKSAHVTLDQDVIGFSITGWPASGVAAELILTISNAGGYSFTVLPTGTLAPGGTIPTITAHTAGDGVDRWRFSSDDGGTTIYLDVIGQDYLAV